MSKFTDWYDRNKEELNAKRRKKYAENAQFRKKTQDKARESYRKNRRVTNPADRRTVVDESGERYFSIGRVARLIGRQPESVRKLHRMGVLPDPVYYDSRGWRLYNRAQALLIRQVFRRLEDKADTDVKSLADVREVLHAEWHTTTGGEGGEG